MHKIKIKDIKVFGNHGVYENEKNKGQYFYFDIEYLSDINISKINDDIHSVVDYIDIIESAKEAFNKHRFNLIEKAANNLIETLFEKYNFKYIKVIVKKIIHSTIDDNNSILVGLEKKHD